jgi:predicted pyridoxine 5'-phosphate oxidase superfamily flavin-nucleotide-binding protein
MADHFFNLTITDSVRDAQAHYYGHSRSSASAAPADALTDEAVDFIRARDSFYLATINENGWPYLQHRGGRAGFLRVLDPRTLAFADYQGNRQMLSTGNIAANDRVALFLIDYVRRERLKILGHARVEDARRHPISSGNWPNPMFSESWNGCFSSKSPPSTGIVPSTSRRVTRSTRFRNWLRH